MAVLNIKKYKVTTIVSDQYLNFGIYTSLKMHLNFLSYVLHYYSITVIGENFGIYSSPLAKNALKFPPWLEKYLEFTHLNWLKMHLNFPP